MRAFVVEDGNLVEAEVDPPALLPRDLLVRVEAISVNPVDTKIRAGVGPGSKGGNGRILGWDASGVVVGVGPDVEDFKEGDEVWYAGALDRPGTYAEFHAVDERLVGRKPSTIGFTESAALPLTAITAWELMFDRMRIGRNEEATLLVIAGAGGVGSIAIQLAKALTKLKVISTASRPETHAWCQAMGAHEVIDHRRPLAAQVKALVPKGVKYVLGLTKVEEHYGEIVELLAPQGSLGLIENVAKPIDVNLLKPKCVSLHWEFMFARAKFETEDMGHQGKLLSEVASLVEAGRVKSTMHTHMQGLTAANLADAHALVASGAAIGKVVLTLTR